MSPSSMIWITALGVFLFEIVFGLVLAYHWLRFADWKMAIVTLLIYATGAAILLGVLITLAASLTL